MGYRQSTVKHVFFSFTSNHHLRDNFGKFGFIDSWNIGVLNQTFNGIHECRCIMPFPFIWGNTKDINMLAKNKI